VSIGEGLAVGCVVSFSAGLCAGYVLHAIVIKFAMNSINNKLRNMEWPPEDLDG